MKVKIDHCWAGGDKHYVLVQLPTGERERLSHYPWSRKAATEALDLLQSLYHIDRTKVRFSVR